MTDITATTTHDDLDQRLTAMQHHAASGVSVEIMGSRIATALDLLHDEGYRNLANDIGRDAVALLDGIEAAQANLAAALELAAKFREQREATRTAWAELRDAVVNCDTDHAAVAELSELLEEGMVESVLMVAYEEATWRIFANTPLSEFESSTVWAILNGEYIDADNIMWRELREWIAAVRERADQ